MCDTECAISFYLIALFISLKMVSFFSWDENGTKDHGAETALGCSSAKRFPAKSLADRFLPSHDMTSFAV